VHKLLPYNIVGSGIKISNGLYEYRITTDDKLPFAQTYIRVAFYTDSKLGLQLLSLYPAKPISSPSAYYKSISSLSDIPLLITRFLTYWNAIFANDIRDKKRGTKIAAITGYLIDEVNDTFVFRTKVARFGDLGPFDVRAYSYSAYYSVCFRKRYVTNETFIYSINPLPSSETFVTAAPTGTFTPIDVSDTITLTDYNVESQADIMKRNMFRSFRLKVDDVRGTQTDKRVEIARMYFYTDIDGSQGNSKVKVDIRTAVATVEGVLTNYYLPPSESTCKTNYTLVVDPETKIKSCVAPSITYLLVDNTACGIGYYNDSGVCKSSGYFQDVLNDALITANSYVPRLRLNLSTSSTNARYLTVDFNSIIKVQAYSFIVGSALTAPTKWTLEGSLDNINWSVVDSKYSIYKYTYPNNIVSFFHAGYFSINVLTPASSTSIGNVGQIPQYAQVTNEIREGFKSPDKNVRRFQIIRWKIRETYVPTAPYVHASTLEFYTDAGPVPISAMKISNPHGSRSSSTNAPNKLLCMDEGYWIDYNKSEILIKFNLDLLPANPIYGFRFTVPSKIEKSIDYAPGKWLLEGSYDGRTWVLLHERVDRARILEYASPIYKFNQQI